MTQDVTLSCYFTPWVRTQNHVQQMFAPACWLGKIKQTCNKTLYETRQQFLQQQRYAVITQLRIPSYTKTYTSTLVNFSIPRALWNTFHGQNDENPLFSTIFNVRVHLDSKPTIWAFVRNVISESQNDFKDWRLTSPLFHITQNNITLKAHSSVTTKTTY